MYCRFLPSVVSHCILRFQQSPSFVPSIFVIRRAWFSWFIPISQSNVNNHDKQGINHEIQGLDNTTRDAISDEAPSPSSVTFRIPKYDETGKRELDEVTCQFEVREFYLSS